MKWAVNDPLIPIRKCNKLQLLLRNIVSKCVGELIKRFQFQHFLKQLQMMLFLTFGESSCPNNCSCFFFIYFPHLILSLSLHLILSLSPFDSLFQFSIVFKRLVSNHILSHRENPRAINFDTLVFYVTKNRIVTHSKMHFIGFERWNRSNQMISDSFTFLPHSLFSPIHFSIFLNHVCN